MKEQERYEKIESWLSGKLNGRAKQKFEAELRENEELALEAEVIRDLKGIGKNSPRKELRKTLSDIRSKSSPKTVSIFRNPRNLMVAASLVILLGAVFLLLPKEKTAAPIVETPETLQEAEVPEINPGEDKPVQEVTPEHFKEDIKKIVKKEKTTVKAAPEKRQPTIEDNPPQTADNNLKIDDGIWDIPDLNELPEGKGYASQKTPFDLNSDIEKVITSWKPDNRFSVKMLNTELNNDAEADVLRYSGIIISSEATKKPNVEIAVYNNEEIAFQNSKPIVKHNLLLNETDAGFSFNFEKTVDLEPGLYYFLIEDIERQTVLKIGKFKLR